MTLLNKRAVLVKVEILNIYFYIKRGRISLIGKMTFCGNDEKSSILLFYPQSLTINYLLLNNPVIFLVTNNLAARLSYAGIIL